MECMYHIPRLLRIVPSPCSISVGLSLSLSRRTREMPANSLTRSILPFPHRRLSVLRGSKVLLSLPSLRLLCQFMVGKEVEAEAAEDRWGTGLGIISRPQWQQYIFHF